MGTRTTIPKPRAVYEDPDAHLDFLTSPSDAGVEGQHFDRKEACRARPDGNVAPSELKRMDEHIAECISAFSNTNRNGGLLVLGIASNGDIRGLEHLNETQVNRLMRLDTKLVNSRCDVKLVEVTNSAGHPDHIGLFYPHYLDNAICEEVGSNPRAWRRVGPQNLVLSDLQREQIKREKRIVDFERTACCEFMPSDLDRSILNVFTQSYLEAASYDWPERELLYQIGAIVRDGDRPESFNHAGLLFFSGNPQRALPHVHIRLLRFDVPLALRGDRALPTYEHKFTGPLTKQIRDFRTFVAESAFFKTYQFRDPTGGFREEPEYLAIAIDEAMVNAVAHRDYAIQIPIHCERYADALVVRSPGALRQQRDLPSHFSLSETQLEHLPRNPVLHEWLKSIRDAKGERYVRALQEGTRRMRDEMLALGLPAPEYDTSPLFTEVILRNDAARREVATGAPEAECTEFANFYPIVSGLSTGARDERRRALLSSLVDRLRAAGWFVDSFRFGTVTAHRRGAARAAPAAVASVVRIYPAYTFQVREYSERPYLVVDAAVVVQSVLNAAEAIYQFGRDRILGLYGIAKWRGWQRVRIVAADEEFCRVQLLEYNAEETIASIKIIPRLPRPLINEAVAATGIHYDLAREIKQAAFALEANAARTRAEHTQLLVEELAETIFPIAVGDANVAISTRPVALSARLDRRDALQLRSLVEPEVEFNHQHVGADIREGIVRYGSFKHSPRDIELVPICAPDQVENMRALISRLNAGKFKYRGAERTFSTKLLYNGVVAIDPSEAAEECERLLCQQSGWRGNKNLSRLFLVHCPESGHSLDDETGPYYKIKRLLLEAGLPCQMVDTPTLTNPDYKDLNLALNIVAKCGVVPWVLPESIPDADFFIGLSYTQSGRGPSERLMGFVNVFNEYGRWLFYSGGSQVFRYEDRALYYGNLVEGSLSRLSLPEEPSIYFHYSAKFSREDCSAILQGARRVRPNGRYTFVWINTQHHVRLYDARPETDGSLARGRYVVTGPHQIYLSTTGYNPYRKSIGTPHVLEINTRTERPDDVPVAPPDLRA
jgi:predicted HTH transcriptional regulator